MNLGAINLSGNDLTGWNLANQNLTQANFTAATLTGVNLTGATVAGATFNGTNFTARSSIPPPATKQSLDLSPFYSLSVSNSLVTMSVAGTSPGKICQTQVLQAIT